jgi:endonuclease/exonuclease/phosphatase family metal-dependent hydrolase
MVSSASPAFSAVRLFSLALALVCVGCRTGRNYSDAAGPRYAGAAPAAATTRGDTVHIVSFNVEFSMEVPRAIHALRTTAALRDADVVLLQEMTAAATKTIADSLRMSHVYYPAIYNRIARRDVGNAVLSRWPIVEDAKLILPAHSRYARTQRIATAATIRFRDRSVRVYSTHLGTPADVSHASRAEQLRYIIGDASRYDHVILGGDMNSKDIGAVAVEQGYAWPTRSIPPSNSFGRIDHIFLKGLVVLRDGAAGTARTAPNISDHRPIWVRAVIAH